MEINKISKISCKHRERGNLTYRLSVEPEQGRGGWDEWNLCQLRMTFLAMSVLYLRVERLFQWVL